jgi:general secretion pathway protein L
MTKSGRETTLIHAAGPRWSWCRVDRMGRVRERNECEPAQASWPGDRPITVLIDAAWCTGLKLELPDMPAARLRQALRWAAEEHLASNAEDEHVVAGPRGDDGLLRALVINRARMRELLAPFQDQAVEVVLPDALCLPWQPGQVSLAERNGRILARWGDWDFGSFEADFLPDLIDSIDGPGVECLWHGGRLPPILAERKLRPQADDALIALVTAAQAPVVNLQSGEFSPGSARAAAGWWRWSAGLAAAVVVLALTAAGLENWMLARQADSLRSAVEAQFQQSFPDVGRVVRGREREQAERELARLRFGESAGLLDLMNRAAPLIEAQGRLHLDALSYRDGLLEINLRAPDVPALDQLEQRLRALGLNADLQSASMDGDGASGRIRISEGRP